MEMDPVKARLLATVEAQILEYGFRKVGERRRIGRSVADLVLYNPERKEACILFTRSRLSREIFSCLSNLRDRGLCVALALDRMPTQDDVDRFRRRGIGLFLVEPTKVAPIVPLPHEKSTAYVDQLKRSVLRGNLMAMAEKVKRWPTPSPVCPNHKTESEPVIFNESGIQMRGWRCKEGDFEIVHPLDAELSLYMKRFGPLRARVSKVGEQFVVRVSKLVAARYDLSPEMELEVDISDLSAIRLRSAHSTAKSSKN